MFQGVIVFLITEVKESYHAHILNVGLIVLLTYSINLYLKLFSRRERTSIWHQNEELLKC